MAYAYTVTNSHSQGNLRSVHGTFTTASGDNTGTLSKATHGLDYIVDSDITIAPGGVNTSNPKKTISAGTISFVFPNTEGYSGTFYVLGR